MKESDSSTCLLALKDAVRGFCEERDWDRFHGAKELAIGISTGAGALQHLHGVSRELAQPASLALRFR